MERVQAEEAHRTQLLTHIALQFSQWQEWRAQDHHQTPRTQTAKPDGHDLVQTLSNIQHSMEEHTQELKRIKTMVPRSPVMAKPTPRLRDAEPGLAHALAGMSRQIATLTELQLSKTSTPGPCSHNDIPPQGSNGALPKARADSPITSLSVKSYVRRIPPTPPTGPAPSIPRAAGPLKRPYVATMENP